MSGQWGLGDRALITQRVFRGESVRRPMPLKAGTSELPEHRLRAPIDIHEFGAQFAENVERAVGRFHRGPPNSSEPTPTAPLASDLLGCGMEVVLLFWR